MRALLKSIIILNWSINSRNLTIQSNMVILFFLKSKISRQEIFNKYNKASKIADNIPIAEVFDEISIYLLLENFFSSHAELASSANESEYNRLSRGKFTFF